MAKAVCRPKLDLKIIFEIDEEEARALDGIAGYGDDAFIKQFKANLGDHYIRDHEAGLRRFLKTIRDVVGVGLHQIDEARKLTSK